MTDHSFFDKFFNDTPKHECNRCGATKNLHAIGDTGGATIYLCTECQEKRDAELQESIEQERRRIEEWAARDEREEA